MVKNNEREYLIETECLTEIIRNMENNISSCIPIMLDRIVKRALYRVDNSENSKKQWIRIMEGDIECTGETRCTITYKDRKYDMSEENYALLKVDNFDDATHLFDLLKYKRDSYQEHRRSKFVCDLDDVKYMVRFDIWPKIEEITFVGITEISAADNDDVVGFVSALGIDNNSKGGNGIDVDSEYKKRFGKSASEIPIVSFDLDF